MMDQDRNTCPGCGAPTPDHSPCPYCGWTAESSENLSSDPPARSPDPAHVPSFSGGSDPEDPDQHSSADPSTQAETDSPAQLKDLLAVQGDEEHLLDQVPEDMRGVLAARLKAAEEGDLAEFRDATASALRDQGYVIGEDARGARIVAGSGSTSDLSASDMVKMAAELEGGVQPQTSLPICGECQAASPVGSENCQWCGKPFADQ